MCNGERKRGRGGEEGEEEGERRRGMEVLLPHL